MTDCHALRKCGTRVIVITGAPRSGDRLERIPKSQRYRLTDCGLKTALFYSRLHQRLLHPGLSQLHDSRLCHSSSLAADFARFKNSLDAYFAEKMVA